jgi:hypothetical protein
MTLLDNSPQRVAITDMMRTARRRASVSLHSYNTLRSRTPGEIVIALEGDDDPIYYRTTISKIAESFSWIPMVCNGKDMVLALRVLLDRNTDADAKRTFFAVDRDFDQLKGHTPGPDLYCTPGYSFENNLVSDATLTELLHGEFRCDLISGDVDRIVALFHQRLAEYHSSMELANRALHFCRVTERWSGSVEKSIGKFVHISLDKVHAKYEFADLPKLVGLPSGVDDRQLLHTAGSFDALTPMLGWRGKFLLAFFVEFLRLLREDRCSKLPTVFDSRKSISFDPKSSIVRVLSAIAEPPICLRAFVAGIAA